jgi:hypothetical protein
MAFGGAAKCAKIMLIAVNIIFIVGIRSSTSASWQFLGLPLLERILELCLREPFEGFPEGFEAKGRKILEVTWCITHSYQTFM